MNIFYLMDDNNILEKTGKALKEWFSILNQQGAKDWSHKSIADHLHEKEKVDYWWAQTLTVEYEREIGRRVKGQTADGSFQLGIRKTIAETPAALWKQVSENSPLWADDQGPALRERFTTFNEDSRESGGSGHFRMPWTRDHWPRPSILQIRVLPSKDPGKAVLSIHQEKLPDLESRKAMKDHWAGILKKIQ